MQVGFYTALKYVRSVVFFMCALTLVCAYVNAASVDFGDISGQPITNSAVEKTISVIYTTNSADLGEEIIFELYEDDSSTDDPLFSISSGSQINTYVNRVTIGAENIYIATAYFTLTNSRIVTGDDAGEGSEYEIYARAKKVSTNAVITSSSIQVPKSATSPLVCGCGDGIIQRTEICDFGAGRNNAQTVSVYPHIFTEFNQNANAMAVFTCSSCISRTRVTLT